MVKEYCDRCKAEIDPHERLSKKIVKITIPSPQSWDGCTRSVTLCSECFSKMGIRETVRNNTTCRADYQLGNRKNFPEYAHEDFQPDFSVLQCGSVRRRKEGVRDCV